MTRSDAISVLTWVIVAPVTRIFSLSPSVSWASRSSTESAEHCARGLLNRTPISLSIRAIALAVVVERARLRHPTAMNTGNDPDRRTDMSCQESGPLGVRTIAQHVGRRRRLFVLCVAALTAGLASPATADNGTRPDDEMVGPGFGLVHGSPAAADGYTLVDPLNTPNIHLVDEAGAVVHSWANTRRPGNSVYLLENGQLLRTAKSDRNVFTEGRGRGGIVELINWGGRVAWHYEYANKRHLQHHDVEPMPNGNVLLLAWEHIDRDEAIAMGRDPALVSEEGLWSEEVVEVDPRRDRIVWRWRMWDHLVQDRDPDKPNYGEVSEQIGRMDVNFDGGPVDWLHANSVAYNAELDQVAISFRRSSEVWVIDHVPSTRKAAGRAGDALFRWGNPAVYQRGDSTDQQLFGQHNAYWIPEGRPGAGHILIFNNGSEDTRPYSSVDEIAPVMRGRRYAQDAAGRFLPATSERVYPNHESEHWLSSAISGAQRQPNGNTLIADGPAGRIFEVTEGGEVVWDYVNPYYDASAEVGTSSRGDPVIPWRVFRAERYPPDHPGLARLTKG